MLCGIVHGFRVVKEIDSTFDPSFKARRNYIANLSKTDPIVSSEERTQGEGTNDFGWNFFGASKRASVYLGSIPKVVSFRCDYF